MKNAKSYAVAVLDLCRENNFDINTVVQELQLVNKTFDEEFVKFLKTPRISINDKKEVFKNAFKDLSKTTFGLLMVLLDNNKILLVNDIIDEINNILIMNEGYTTVEVVSINKLTDNEKNAIINYFMNKLNKKIKLVETIDKKLVGGLVIKYNGKLIDGSIFTKAESLKEYLKK